MTAIKTIIFALLYLQKASTNCVHVTSHLIRCPEHYNDAGITVEIKPNQEILIDCNNLEHFNVTLLPRISGGGVRKLRMRFCPLPDSFEKVLNSLSINQTEMLEFIESPHRTISLKSAVFHNLDKLKVLILKSNNLKQLDEDVFKNVPNLISLELQDNFLSEMWKIFSSTPLLSYLDLSANNLNEISPPKHKTQLKVLQLSDNNIKRLDNTSFQGLNNLEFLDLSANKLQLIAENTFERLRELVVVNLSNNNLTTLSWGLFGHCTRLESVLLAHNPELLLPDYLFANLPMLQEVDLSNCKLELIPGGSFRNSLNLKAIMLEANNLKQLPDGLFKNLHNIEQVFLQENQLEKVVFGLLQRLKTLHLHNNLITSIDEEVFAGLVNIEEIYLQWNKISFIESGAFSQNENIKIVDLSNNCIEDGTVSSRWFEQTSQLESVDFSFNQITQIEDVINLDNKIYLKLLNFSYNHIGGLKLSTLTNIKDLEVDLRHNKIKWVNFENIDVAGPGNSIIDLSHNPIECDCFNFEFLEYVKRGLKNKFAFVVDDGFCRDGSLAEVACSLAQLGYDACPKECSCKWRPYDHALVVDCSNKNMINYPQIGPVAVLPFRYKQLELHLENNSLSKGPPRLDTNYSKVTKLFLAHNKIKQIDWVPSNLQVLSLHSNTLQNLSVRFLNQLSKSNIANLTLHQNPWTCDCNVQGLTNFLRLHTKQVDPSFIHCVDSARRVVTLNEREVCLKAGVQFVFALTSGAILTFLLLLSIGIALYHRFNEEVKIWLYAKKLCLHWVTEADFDKNKPYDVFISYSSKDEAFVAEHLVRELEAGPQPYKLCLHYRNWIPGEFISKQIIKSVSESRRTLIVLSPNYLDSIWGKMEFHAAHTQAVQEERVRVVVVLYGDVNVDQLTAELRAYLNTNTFVRWGDPYFWDKLKWALPHRKT